MNRKILLLITCITLQSSIYANNWTEIFTILKSNGTLGQNQAPTTTVRTWLGSLANTAEGKIAIDYVGVGAGAANSAAIKQFKDALAVFENNGSAQPVGDTIATNWDNAIAAFDTAENVYKKATTITRAMPTSLATTAAHYKNAGVVLQWLQGTSLNATDAAQLDAAFKRATGYPWNSATDAANMAAAATTLKSQIDAAIRLYNSTVGVSGSGVTTRYVLPA